MGAEREEESWQSHYQKGATSIPLSHHIKLAFCQKRVLPNMLKTFGWLDLNVLYRLPASLAAAVTGRTRVVSGQVFWPAIPIIRLSVKKHVGALFGRLVLILLSRFRHQEERRERNKRDLVTSSPPATSLSRVRSNECGMTKAGLHWITELYHATIARSKLVYWNFSCMKAHATLESSPDTLNSMDAMVVKIFQELDHSSPTPQSRDPFTSTTSFSSPF